MANEKPFELVNRLERFAKLKQIADKINRILVDHNFDQSDAIRFLLGLSVAAARNAKLPFEAYLVEVHAVWAAADKPTPFVKA